jgi:hypothetical protein
MNQSSVLNCINLISGGDHTILFYYGNQTIDSTNTSNNICGFASGFYFYAINSGKVSYTFITNNIDFGLTTSSGCTRFHEGSAQKSSYVDHSNYINNSQLITSEGIIVYSNHNLYLNNCSFFHNRENELGKLVHKDGGSGSCTIEYSYIDDKTNQGHCNINHEITNEIISPNLFIFISNCNDFHQKNNIIHNKKSYYFHFINFSTLKFLFSLPEIFLFDKL